MSGLLGVVPLFTEYIVVIFRQALQLEPQLPLDCIRNVQYISCKCLIDKVIS